MGAGASSSAHAQDNWGAFCDCTERSDLVTPRVVGPNRAAFSTGGGAMTRGFSSALTPNPAAESAPMRPRPSSLQPAGRWDASEEQVQDVSLPSPNLDILLNKTAKKVVDKVRKDVPAISPALVGKQYDKARRESHEVYFKTVEEWNLSGHTRKNASTEWMLNQEVVRHTREKLIGGGHMRPFDNVRAYQERQRLSNETPSFWDPGFQEAKIYQVDNKEKGVKKIDRRTVIAGGVFWKNDPHHKHRRDIPEEYESGNQEAYFEEEPDIVRAVNIARKASAEGKFKVSKKLLAPAEVQVDEQRQRVERMARKQKTLLNAAAASMHV